MELSVYSGKSFSLCTSSIKICSSWWKNCHRYVHDYIKQGKLVYCFSARDVPIDIPLSARTLSTTILSTFIGAIQCLVVSSHMVSGVCKQNQQECWLLVRTCHQHAYVLKLATPCFSLWIALPDVSKSCWCVDEMQFQDKTDVSVLQVGI